MPRAYDDAMIETKCPCCGGKVLKPDPPARTPLERIQVEKDWDARYQQRKEAK